MNTNSEEVKKVLRWVWIALVVFVLFLGVETIGAFRQLGEASPSYNSISVTGEGEAIALPDVASFTFSVSADAKTPDGAQGLVTGKMNTILKELENMGIEERDIKTTDYSVWPKYKYEVTPMSYPCSQWGCPPPGWREVADGYTVNHSVLIKVRDMGDAGEVLALVGKLGATNISGISFTIDDEDAVIQEARLEAIEDARTKAKVLAKGLGVRLVRVVSFYDNTGGYPIPYYAEGIGGDAMVKTVSAPEIPTGENKFSANVTVVYEIR